MRDLVTKDAFFYLRNEQLDRLFSVIYIKGDVKWCLYPTCVCIFKRSMYQKLLWSSIGFD